MSIGIDLNFIDSILGQNTIKDGDSNQNFIRNEDQYHETPMQLDLSYQLQNANNIIQPCIDEDISFENYYLRPFDENRHLDCFFDSILQTDKSSIPLEENRLFDGVSDTIQQEDFSSIYIEEDRLLDGVFDQMQQKDPLSINEEEDRLLENDFNKLTQKENYFDFDMIDHNDLIRLDDSDIDMISEEITSYPFFSIDDAENDENIFSVQVGGSNRFFHLVSSNQSFNEQFKTRSYRFEIKFREIQGSFDSNNQQIVQLFSQLYSFVQSKISSSSSDRVSFTFDHPDLFYSISHPLIVFNQLKIEDILYLVENVSQSRRSLRVDENFSLSILLVYVPTGTGSLEVDYLQNTNCIKFVINSDNMCAIRSVLIAKAYVDDSRDKTDFVKLNSVRLEEETHKVARKLDLFRKPCSLKEIALIEKYFRHYRICVFDKQTCIYKGVSNKKNIYLLFSNNHYNAITNIKAYFSADYFCHDCLKPFKAVGKHKCDNMCQICNHPKCFLVQSIKCSYCSVFAKSEKCLRFHQENFCKVLKKCEVCDGFKSTNHVCIDEKFCFNCKQSVKSDHLCFVKTEEEKNERKKTTNNSKLFGYIFFDYESTQEYVQHKANLICAIKLCLKCIEKSDGECPQGCGKHEFDSNISFCDWLFNQRHFVAIAHNMKGYDGVFIMNYLISHILPKDKKPTIIVQGTKILSIHFRHVKIIDSFSFIPVSLSEFSSAFGIVELKKGFFPHLFNTDSNQNYVGAYPDPEFYGVQNFSLKKLDEFNTWYQSVKHLEFDFRKELTEYCWSDVMLLSAGCLKFREIIMDLTRKECGKEIDPFENSITIASLCHLIYRTSLLKSKTLPYIPENGYCAEKNHSFKSILWLNYISMKENVDIEHAQNKGEKQFGKYFLDGYDPNNKIGYEFHGCYFHGCQKCFTPETFNQVKQCSMKSVYEKHCDRIKYLEKCVKIVQIWECEFDKIKDDVLEKVKHNQTFSSPLLPREALFGGRTNALRLYYDAKDDEEIRYVDFTSLYPYVQKYEEYPVGHPIVIKKNFGDPMKYFGLIKCRILPPRNLYLPVLPSKINGKLKFALCRTCAEFELSECCHDQSERALEGTWVTLEIQKAISLGYKILTIFEVWHWNEKEKYDTETKSGGLFTKYINLFLKGKQEASGFPSVVCTESDKKRFCDEYFAYEGIKLDENLIEKNPAKRFVFKLALNSMWGRLGMNTDRTSYKIITKPAEWFAMVQDDQFIIKHADFSSPNVAQVFYSLRNVEGSAESSVVHACFVTSHARLKLYSELEKIGDRVLYFDTDSIIYVHRKNLYCPKLGNFLGQLTNELDEGDYIKSFVSGGPKNYAYLTNKGKLSCTVKGFKLDTKTNREKINFEIIKEIVLNDRSRKIKLQQMLFKRNKKNWSVECEQKEKFYGVVYDKRILLNNLSTLPFGF